MDYFNLHVEFYRIEGYDQVFLRYKDKIPEIINPLDINKVKFTIISAGYYIYRNIYNYIVLIKSFNIKLDLFFKLIIYSLFCLGWSLYLYY